MRRAGFSSIELMMVMLVVAVCSTMLLSIYVRGAENARLSTCLSNLSQLGTALHMYAQDYSGRFPPTSNNFTPLVGRHTNSDLLWCPKDDRQRDPIFESSSRDDDAAVQMAFSSYCYNGGYTNADSPDIPLVAEGRCWHPGVYNVFYIRGDARSVPERDWRPFAREAYVPPDPNPRPKLEPLPWFGGG